MKKSIESDIIRRLFSSGGKIPECYAGMRDTVEAVVMKWRESAAKSAFGKGFDALSDAEKASIVERYPLEA